MTEKHHVRTLKIMQKVSLYTQELDVSKYDENLIRNQIHKITINDNISTVFPYTLTYMKIYPCKVDFFEKSFRNT